MAHLQQFHIKVDQFGIHASDYVHYCIYERNLYMSQIYFKHISHIYVYTIFKLHKYLSNRNKLYTYKYTCTHVDNITHKHMHNYTVLYSYFCSIDQLNIQTCKFCQNMEPAWHPWEPTLPAPTDGRGSSLMKSGKLSCVQLQHGWILASYKQGYFLATFIT